MKTIYTYKGENGLTYYTSRTNHFDTMSYEGTPGDFFSNWNRDSLIASADIALTILPFDQGINKLLEDE